MKRITYKIPLLLLSLVSMTLWGCKKEDELDEFFPNEYNESARRQLVFFQMEDEVTLYARDVNPTIDTFALIEVRRSPNTQAELNQSLTVKVARDTGVIGRYNRAHNAHYVELPASSYTLLGDLNNITFAPGEFVKQIRIRLDKSQLNLANQYALGFTITDAGTGATIRSDYRHALYEVGIKNEYDGVYELRARTEHPTNATLVGAVGPREMILATSGPKSVTFMSPHPWANGSNSQLPGGYEPTLTVGVDNSVTVTNPNGLGIANTPGYPSRYDPNTRTFYVQWRYLGGGGYRQFTDTLVYLRPR